MAKTMKSHPQGFAKPITIKGGVGDHSELGTITFATYALLCKQGTIASDWVRCDQCNGMHMYEGIGVKDISAVEYEGPQAVGASNGRTKTVNTPLRC